MSQFHLTQFASGDTVFVEGSDGSVAYLIRSGSIVIHRHVEGEDVLLALLGPGEVFGEMALVTEGRRTATATAAEETELVALADSAFNQHLQRGTPLLREVFASMAKRLEFTSRQLRKPRTKYPIQSVCRVLEMVRDIQWLQRRQTVPMAEVIQQIQGILDLNVDEICHIFDQMAAARLIDWRNNNGEPIGTVYFIEPESFASRLARFLDSLPEKAVSSLDLRGSGDAAASVETAAAQPSTSPQEVYLDLLTVEKEHGMSFWEIRRYIASGELPPDMIHFPAAEMLTWIGHMRVAYGDERTDAYPSGTAEA